jgi:DNA-binding GntR family transcriptional regulator
MPINTSTRLQQVKEYLLRFIEQAQLQHNDQLPSESSIAQKLGVSRNTLREAYVALENEGVIVRRHGIGTFISHSRVIRDPLNEFLPFAQIIQASGYEPGFQTLAMSFERAPEDVCEALNVPLATELRHIKRLVRADQRPVIYVDDFISPAVEAADLNWDAFDGNMIQFLASSIRPSLSQIHSRIRVMALDAEISRYLELPAGTLILNVRSAIFTVENKPVAFSKVCFNSDIVELSIVRTIRTH